MTASSNADPGSPKNPQRLLLKDASVLSGPDLDYVPRADIMIADDIFEYVTPAGSDVDDIPSHDAPQKTIDCRGMLVIPGLINCHTHIGDSVGKDARLHGTVDEKIHPVFGLKSRILSQTHPDTLAAFMTHSCISMLRGGTTTFVDFREGGIEGALMIRRALHHIPIRGIILGRLDYYQDEDQICNNQPMPGAMRKGLARLVLECDGIGISGANENSNRALDAYAKCNTLRAIHSSESVQSVMRSKKMTDSSETARALLLRPHFLIHMTNAAPEDLDMAACNSETRGVVICPRANSALAEGVPDIPAMLGRTSERFRLALGTDNVMINAPDMFREMDYTWKVAMGMGKKEIKPVEILKMATVNAGIMLEKNIGQIARGMLADCIFLDKHSIELEPMHNPHAAIVHRASASSVRAVMVGGKIVHGEVGRRQ